MLNHKITVLAVMLCAGCVPSKTIGTASNGADREPSDNPVAELAALMMGRFAEDGETPIFDFRAKLPQMGDGQWVYYQRDRGKRDAGDTRKAYRQRVLQLVDRPDGRVAQITWSLKDASGYATAPNNPAILDALSREALAPLLADACEQIWMFEGGIWRGRVDPARCVIFSKRRNTRIAIGSETRLSDDALQEAERGFDLDGVQLWGTAPGAFSTMLRVSAD